MHPIEHLRYLAGASTVDDVTLVTEAAYALSAMPDDPSMLVVVCRRLIERHERCAPLWWLCSSVLASSEPSRTAWESLQSIEMDPTLDQLVAAIPGDSSVAVGRWTDSANAISATRSDIVLVDAAGTAASSVIEVVAASPGQVLIERSDEPLMRFGQRYLVCRLGTRLPEPVVAEIHDRWDSELISLTPTEFSMAVTPQGPRSMQAPDVLGPDGPFAPELLRRSVGP